MDRFDRTVELEVLRGCGSVTWMFCVSFSLIFRVKNVRGANWRCLETRRTRPNGPNQIQINKSP